MYKPSKQFWITNLAGWGLAAIGNALLQYFMNDMSLTKGLVGLIPIAWAFLFTTGLRFYWGYRNIYAQKHLKLFLILILQAVLVSVLIDITTIGNILLIQEYDQSLTMLCLRNFPAISSAVLIWIALYYGIIYSMNLRKKEIENLKLENLLQTARLSNLRNQLNPHFLFNALNNIKSLIREDGEKAREMISSLTDILRYSLNSGIKHTVTVQEELAFVMEYLELEHLHMEGRLLSEVRMDEQAGSCLIPPMMIQNLVENAIKHGISLLPNGGSIVVEMKCDGERLEIRVTNTGSLSSVSRTDGNGVGISNIRSRLKMQYGDRAGFEICETGDSVAATIHLPMEQEYESAYRRGFTVSPKRTQGSPAAAS